MNLFPNLYTAIKATGQYLLRTGEVVVTEKWQGRSDLNNSFFEALNWSFSCPIPFTEEELVRQVKPNVEWCNAQFLERIGGVPLNPGESYKIWPYYKNNPGNDKFRKDEKFSHTYMERFWPKYAGDWMSDENRKHENIRAEAQIYDGMLARGIRYELGDYNDLIDLLAKEPNTRQAYLPIWFPEDTGAVHGGRVPCTIGYWFIKRQGALHITYHIRACDYFRHLRDDIYLACLLVNHVLLQLRCRDLNTWSNIHPGIFTMNIGSLHIFSNEIKLLKNETH